MNLNWDLTNLYESFSGKDYQDDLNNLDMLIEKLNIMSKEMTINHENEGAKLEAYIGVCEALSKTIEKLGV